MRFTMPKDGKKKISILIITGIMLFLICMLGPLDVFTYEYYCNGVEYDEIYPEDFIEYIDLGKEDFVQIFQTTDKHFAGFELNFINQPEGNTGNIRLGIYNVAGKLVDEILIDASTVTAGEWYRAYLNKELKEDECYELHISAIDCAVMPYLQIVHSDYLPGENVEGNLLIGYLYKNSTFNLYEKIFISLIIIAIYFACVRRLVSSKVAVGCEQLAIALVLIALLAWHYMYNFMDNNNTLFDDFQADSEFLGEGALNSKYYGLSMDGYGLGYYWGIDGFYSETEPVVYIWNNSYAKEVAVVGNVIQFGNGDVFLIESVEENEAYRNLRLNAPRALHEAKYGSITNENIRFYNANMEQCEPGKMQIYESQYGLQGKIYRFLAPYMNCEEALEHMHFACAMLTAIVFVLITLLIYRKYNLLMAGCFYITFLLSPWTTNFARNLYWVEFTWFLPMLVGLICSIKIDKKSCRMACYVLTAVTVAIKSLCGYEYITTVMIGLISFLLVDWMMAFVEKDKSRIKLIFGTIFIMGIMALFGFAFAMCLHANVRGEGNVIEGLKIIIEKDALRRTSGLNPDELHTEALSYCSESVWQVLCKYFQYSTEIIAGIPGNLYPTLCIGTLCIFICDYRKKQLCMTSFGLYVVFFLTAISWFVLAKAHSSAHDHINFVLWYFGFVQINMYVICDKVYKLIKRKE